MQLVANRATPNMNRGPRAAASASTGGSSRTRRSRSWPATLALAVGVVLLLAASWPVARRVFVGTGIATLIALPGRSIAKTPIDPNTVDLAQRIGEIRYTEGEWQKRLTPEQYAVLRREATERRFTSALNEEKRAGTFMCAGCGAPVFASSAKYESGTGWPSFYDALPGAVTEVVDRSIPFMTRTEVRCKRCQGHLGHVFDDGPAPTGLRYCMNGVALLFEPNSTDGRRAAA